MHDIVIKYLTLSHKTEDYARSLSSPSSGLWLSEAKLFTFWGQSVCPRGIAEIDELGM